MEWATSHKATGMGFVSCVSSADTQEKSDDAQRKQEMLVSRIFYFLTTPDKLFRSSICERERNVTNDFGQIIGLREESFLTNSA